EYREHVRELLEGIVRPIGALIGTVGVILMQIFFMGDNLIFVVNLMMVVFALVMIYVAYVQRDKYTDSAISDLLTSDEKIVRFNAIDILAQRGHRKALNVLEEVLLDLKESISIK